MSGYILEEQRNPNATIFSRASSHGSVNTISCSSASSTHNTDDEDSEETSVAATNSYKDKRREAHTQAEQKRRDAIKKGYDELLIVIPTSNDNSCQKLSKATILQKSIDYIQFLMQQRKKQEEELEALQKELTALKIMKGNYEQIVQAHQSHPQPGNSQITDEEKFKIFQEMMDNLFISFDENVSVSSFQELSRCCFNWLEEYCKPGKLHDILLNVIHNSNIVPVNLMQ